LVEERYHNETISEGGLKIDIEYSWGETSRFTKSLSTISNSQYGMFPNSLGVVFKIGF